MSLTSDIATRLGYSNLSRLNDIHEKVMNVSLSYDFVEIDDDDYIADVTKKGQSAVIDTLISNLHPKANLPLANALLAVVLLLEDGEVDLDFTTSLRDAINTLLLSITESDCNAYARKCLASKIDFHGENGLTAADKEVAAEAYDYYVSQGSVPATILKVLGEK